MKEHNMTPQRGSPRHIRASPSSVTFLARRDTAQQRMDPYHLEEKALTRWERQRETWEKMSRSLVRRTGTRPNGTTNFSTATTQTREHNEDFGMVQSAVPQAELSNYYAWEALLRCTDASKAVRYVQIGKAYYPYAIFGEVQDSSSLKPSNPAYSRIVSDQQSGSQGSQRRQEARDSVRQRMAMGDDKEAVAQFLLEEDDYERRYSDYYRSQLQKFSFHIQKKFPHFLVPRQFLQVEGGRTPRMTSQEHEEVEEMEKQQPPSPTKYYPPPQNVRLAVMTPMSATDAIRVQNESLQQINANSTNNMVAMTTEANEPELMHRGPSLIISTRRLLFRGYPGELVHGHIRLKNTSSVTVYYSWMPVDLIQEALREGAHEGTAGSNDNSPSFGSIQRAPTLQLPQLSGENGGKPFAPSAKSDSSTPAILVGADATTLQYSRQLHALATRCKKANSYFRLSSPINGVILPDESELFPFSMRAPHEGSFKHMYELLTIPPSPDRILIELCGLVASPEPTADMLSQPLELALREKAGVDRQRHLVQSLACRLTPYQESDILQEMEEIRKRKVEEDKAKTTKREREAARWESYNKHTFDAIPYHPAVYDKLVQLYENLETTMRRLGAPLHHRHWDGSLTYMLIDIGVLRDAASRSILLEGFFTLLRAARVSQNQPDMDLEGLLHLAASALAQQGRESAEEQIRREVEFSQYPREPINMMPVGKAKRGGGGNGGGSAGARKHTPEGRRENKNENYVVTGPFRTPAIGTEPEEMDLLQAEYDLLLEDQLAALDERTTAREEQVFHHFRHAIDLACDLPLLDVVQGSRAESIQKIQSIEEMEVDNGSEVIPPKLGKGKQRG